jgi:uncharacterized protein YfbU (UPF0304 family)
MKLDLKERYIISNQLKILEALYPDDAKSYETDRKAIENGYSLNYNWLTQYFSKEMSIEECKEVLDILDMYRAITAASSKGVTLDENDEGYWWTKFKGFDGNNETEQYSYAYYVIMDLERFTELRYDAEYPDFNSHMPTLEKYRRMLAEWRRTDNSFQLDRTQLTNILRA